MSEIILAYLKAWEQDGPLLIFQEDEIVRGRSFSTDVFSEISLQWGKNISEIE